MRRILHLDMDAFYASIAQRDEPSLRGKPVAVGGSPHGRGVVAAASYEARAFGVRSAMSMARAVQLCPSLVIVPPAFHRYREISNTILGVYRHVTPLVEPLSLDEAFLDVTENAWGEPLGITVAKRLKSAVREATGLTVSAGVAPNKYLAKIASGWKKPDGLTVIAPERVEEFLRHLPVDALCGVGPKTAKKLHAAGVTRVTDVRTIDPDRLHALVGSMAGWLTRLAAGIDDRPVVPHRDAKSSGAEHTFAEDLSDLPQIRDQVARLADRAARWLERHELYARTVTIKVRYDDFTTLTRRHSESPTRDPGRIIARAVALVDRTDAGRRPVRLLGVSVQGFASSLDPERPATPETRLPFEGDGAK